MEIEGLRRTTILLTLLLAGAGPAHAGSFFGGSSDCEAVSPPSVTVEGIPFATVFDHGTSVERLSLLGPQETNSLGVGVSYTQGLVVAELASTADYGMVSENLPDGSWCTRAETVKVRFGAPTPATVHVASQYPAGSCAFVAVLAHEEKHVAMYRRVIATMQPWLERNLPSRIAATSAAKGATAKASQDALVAGMKTSVDPLLSYAHSYADGWSKSVDTPSEYARVHAQCTEWYEDSIDIDRIAASRR